MDSDLRAEKRFDAAGETGGLDLLEIPALGRFLKWRYSRMTMQAVMLVFGSVMILHGFFGPQLAPENLATLLTWVHYRGVLILVLLVAGNFFCMACPFMLPRELARWLDTPKWNWPRWLRNKWLAAGLFAAILFAYELFDLWGDPWWTAWLILAYFLGALLVDALFKHASFCKYVCPIGQFNFVSSTVSPMEVAVNDSAVCAECETVDCIKGTRDPDDRDEVIQRGCELALFQPEKVGNMDCTFCLDCVYACPHDNIGITTRVPGSELWSDEQRSGVGRFSHRSDISALAILFTFGALLNAFGMVSPVYAVQAWLADLMNTTAEAPVLGALFLGTLVVEPAVLLGGAAQWTRSVVETDQSLLGIVGRFSYALIPLGVGVWAAHYSFHLLTGIWTVVPVVQEMVQKLGIGLLGDPMYTLTGLPQAYIYPLEIGMIGLGAFGSVLVAQQIAEREYGDEDGLSALVPWALLCTVLAAAAVWLLSQPMEMRGTFLGS